MSKLKIESDKGDISEVVKSAINAEIKRLEIGLDKRGSNSKPFF